MAVLIAPLLGPVLSGDAGMLGWLAPVALSAFSVVRMMPARVNKLSMPTYMMVVLAVFLLYGVGQKVGHQMALYKAELREAEKVQNRSRDVVYECSTLSNRIRFEPTVDKMCCDAAALQDADIQGMAWEKRMLAMPSLPQLVERAWDSVANRVYVMAAVALTLLLAGKILGVGAPPVRQIILEKRGRKYQAQLLAQEGDEDEGPRDF